MGASAPTITSSPVTAGAKSALFTMPARGTRSEIVPTTAEFTEGQDRWFRFSFYLPTSFPTQVTSWQVITQWKNDGDGSPPLEITVGGGNLKLEGGYGYPGGSRQFAQVLAPATTGARTDLVLHVFFSRVPGKGSVDVWRNGAQVLSGYKPAGGTLYPTSSASTATTELLLEDGHLPRLGDHPAGAVHDREREGRQQPVAGRQLSGCASSSSVGVGKGSIEDVAQPCG